MLCLNVFHTMGTLYAVSKHVPYSGNISAVSKHVPYNENISAVSKCVSYSANISVVFKRVPYSVNISVMFCYRCERSAASHMVQRPESSYLEN